MNRNELHSTPQFHPPSLLAGAVYLQNNIPRKRGGDATGLINNEGYVNGFLDAIEALKAVALPEAPKAEKKSFQPYSAPQQPQPQSPENHNQK